MPLIGKLFAHARPIKLDPKFLIQEVVGKICGLRGQGGQVGKKCGPYGQVRKNCGLRGQVVRTVNSQDEKLGVHIKSWPRAVEECPPCPPRILAQNSQLRLLKLYSLCFGLSLIHI